MSEVAASALASNQIPITIIGRWAVQSLNDVAGHALIGCTL